MTEHGCDPIRRHPRAPRRRQPPADRPWHLRRRRHAARHAARLLRAQPVRPGHASTASTPPAALALPGVRAVFTADDLNPDVKEAWHAVAGKDIPDTPRPPLAEGEVKFVGDPVALVVAESRYLAEDAVELVDVDYEPLPAVADFTQAVGGADRRRRARGLPRQRRGRHGRRAAGRGDVFAAPPMSHERTSTNRSTRRCRWRRAAWSSSGRRPRRN